MSPLALGRLPTDALATFVVFADHLNFTRAARALHLSQPAVFQQVRRLSEALSATLYRRQGPRLELTPEGKQVAAFARELEARTQRLQAALAGHEVAEPAVLCAGEGAYLYLLGGVISRLVAAGLGLRLMTRDAEGTVEALLVGQAHAGVAVIERPPRELEARPLRETPQVLVVPRQHPLAGRRRCRLVDLRGARLIAPPAGRPHRALLDLAARTASLDWQIVVEASGWPLMLRFVKLGVGVAIVNGCCRLPAGLVAIPLPELPPTRYLALRRRGPLEGPERRLWEALETLDG